MIYKRIASYRRMPRTDYVAFLINRRMYLYTCFFRNTDEKNNIDNGGLRILGSPYHIAALDRSSWLLHAGPAHLAAHAHLSIGARRIYKFRPGLILHVYPRNGLCLNIGA